MLCLFFFCNRSNGMGILKACKSRIFVTWTAGTKGEKPSFDVLVGIKIERNFRNFLEFINFPGESLDEISDSDIIKMKVCFII